MENPKQESLCENELLWYVKPEIWNTATLIAQKDWNVIHAHCILSL